MPLRSKTKMLNTNTNHCSLLADLKGKLLFQIVQIDEKSCGNHHNVAWCPRHTANNTSYQTSPINCTHLFANVDYFHYFREFPPYGCNNTALLSNEINSSSQPTLTNLTNPRRRFEALQFYWSAVVSIRIFLSREFCLRRDPKRSKSTVRKARRFALGTNTIPRQHYCGFLSHKYFID